MRLPGLIHILHLMSGFSHSKRDALYAAKNVCFTYCILPGWPLGGPSVVCRPARAAHTRCCRWCRRCRTQAGGTPHTPMRTHTAHSGNRRLPRKSSWHRPHLDGDKAKRLSVCFVCVCVCVSGIFNHFSGKLAPINTQIWMMWSPFYSFHIFLKWISTSSPCLTTHS